MTSTTAVAAAERTAAATGAGRRTSRAHRPTRLPRIALYVALGAIAVVYLYPFLVEIATSFKTNDAATSDPVGLIPVGATLAAYRQLFTNSDFPLWFFNSTVVTVVVTAARVLFDSAAGYALARLPFRGRGVLSAGIVAVLAVPGVVLLIPKFLIINTLGIYDSYTGMIIPLFADAAGVFIMRNFFASIPVAVEEAARVDGAGTFRIFWSVVLPMAQPALVTILILSFQGSWNELGSFVVSTQNPALDTLTKGVASLASGALGSGNLYPLRLGAALIMTLPVAVLFFVFQRRIADSASGSVKE